MANDRIHVYTTLLEQCREETLKTAGAMASTRCFVQLKPGKATPLWLMGHLANTVHAVVLVFTLGEKPMFGKDLAMKFAPGFAGGEPPTNNPGDYPPWDEVLQRYQDVMSAAVARVPVNLTDAALPTPPAHMPEPMRGIFGTVETVLQRMVLHDSYHRGQIGILHNL